jgi:curved DNA-binding protein CbpA
MNPYAILGVSTTATDLEIKRAYRTQVKRYHPDRGSLESSHDRIVAINYAYDILSDPDKRAQYDRGFATLYSIPEPQEDPLEAYKREYKRKRWEREKKEREEKLARKKTIYLVLRVLHVPVLVFGAALMLNDWLADETWVFWHVVMTLNAGYICYQGELTDFAFRLTQWNLFIFMITLLVMFG